MGVASLVFGILSIIISFSGFAFQWAGAILALIGMVLASSARKNPETRGLGTGGLVCSIIGFILCIIFYVGCTACLACFTALPSSY